MNKNSYDNLVKIFVILSAVGFVLLALVVHFFPHSSLDVLVSQEVQEEFNEERAIDLSSPISMVSIFGNSIISFSSVVIMSLLFLFTSHRRESLFVLFVFIADGLNFLLKLVTNRPRPTSDVVQVLEKFNHSSFPSGHVVHYVVFFGFLLFIILFKKMFVFPMRIALSLILLFLILTIPISRIYLGAHWATDVLGGYLVGFIFLSGMLSFYLKKRTG